MQVEQPAKEEEKAQSTCEPVNFAAQMMASLSTLKAKSSIQKEEQDKLAAQEAERIEAQRLKEEEEQRRGKSRYVPSNPVVLKSAAAMGLDHEKAQPVNGRRVLEVKRPAEIEAARYDLPVSGMEYEIVDTVRNNDVTILCGETGSGKSTQVVQFLYEAGFSLNDDKDDDLLIGVTQPRRVAAVSTAKRVCYEMGHGDGQRIKNGPSNGGNLVAYQTRYETAGLGRDTRVKFMTDGILLQEIQSDLLLRKYGAIVLDEAHERNLNTDVLLGLLSVAVPLRKKAALEEGSGISPLKLVIMSATLRVEDFTGNSRLFPETTPALVKVPGRTHPVTLHHSKITELDDYGKCHCPIRILCSPKHSRGTPLF
jgi:HrpA-like RNA helicase